MAKFQPGQSGNPRGRSKGSGKVAKLREQIAEHVPALVQQLIAAALDGDTMAARVLLDRALPPLRPTDEPVRIPMPDDATLAEQGREILLAATAGRITAAQCNALMTAIGSQVRIVEATELEARIAALEASNAQSR